MGRDFARKRGLRNRNFNCCNTILIICGAVKAKRYAAGCIFNNRRGIDIDIDIDWRVTELFKMH